MIPERKVVQIAPVGGKLFMLTNDGLVWELDPNDVWVDSGRGDGSKTVNRYAAKMVLENVMLFTEWEHEDLLERGREIMRGSRAGKPKEAV